MNVDVIAPCETIHIVVETAEWKTDRSHCGVTGVAREASEGTARRFDGVVCEKCEEAAPDKAVALYELADSSGMTPADHNA